MGGIRDGETIGISNINTLGSQGVRLTLDEGLIAGENYLLDISSNIEDVAGNNLPENTTLDLAVAPPSITEISPSNGAEMVPLTRETVVRFNVQIDPNTVTEESLYLIANGQRIAGRRVVSSTNKFVTFFYDEPLPSSTEIRVVVDGDKITTMNGIAIDADGDGNLGGIVTVDFSTLPITRIEGSDVFGYVFDSFNTDENGENIPVVGATIRLDALPNVFAVTDETGFFRLEDVPAPELSVHIDGGTATNAPEGTVYATVGKIFHSIPGQETQLIMDGDPFDVFLPPMATADIQPLAAEADTDVGFGEASKAQLEALFPDIDPSLWDEVIVTFPVGSAQDEEGNVATQAAIIPVAPDRLPAPLPPTINPQLVISIQAGGENGFSQTEGGATNFDVPAPIQFPNLEGLEPGEKSLIWSFDHDAGDWVVIGTGTVSDDGKVITSDEGVGILAPGWHFVQPGFSYQGDTDELNNEDKSIFDLSDEALSLLRNSAATFLNGLSVAASLTDNVPILGQIPLLDQSLNAAGFLAGAVADAIDDGEIGAGTYASATVALAGTLNPEPISGADTFFAAREIARNGSGLGLVASEGQGVALYDISDPNDTDDFITRFDTPGFTNDIAIASGIAYVADDSGGLQVINYRSFDNLGQAPTISINASVSDLDPNAEDIQIQEGTKIPILFDAFDDVQVRNVTLIINGEEIATDVSFPFDLTATAPNITSNSNTVDIQVRATDTGGNSALSNVLTFDLVEDTFAPVVTSTTPNVEGGAINVSAITLRFSEELDTSLINSSGLTLTNLGSDSVIGDGDDTVVMIEDIATPRGDRLVISLGNVLEEGKYQLLVNLSIIADNAGNFLAAPFILEFTNVIDPGSTPGEALDLGLLTTQQTFNDSVSPVDQEDYYRFSIDNTSNFSFDFTELNTNNDSDVLLIQDANNNGEFDNGEIVFNPGESEDIELLLEAGTYFINVLNDSNFGGTSYRFTLSN